MILPRLSNGGHKQEKSQNEEQRKAVNSQVIEPMRLNNLYTKYTSMIAASIYIPAWLSKAQEAQKNNFANISYVAIPVQFN